MMVQILILSLELQNHAMEMQGEWKNTIMMVQILILSLELQNHAMEM